MTLRIGDALRQGAIRTFERNGLILVAVFVVFGFLNTVVTQSLMEAYFQVVAAEFGTMPVSPGTSSGTGMPFPTGQGGMNLAVSIPLSAAAGLALVFALVAEALRIVTIRVFATGETQTVPSDLVRRNLSWATLNGFVAGVVTWMLIGIGFVFIVFPAVFLAMSFYFVRQVIAVEDANLVEAIKRAWNLSSGNRLELFGLVVVVWLVGVGVSVPTLAVSFFAPLVGTIVSIAVSGFVTVFGIAVATRAFEQLRPPATEAAEESPADFGATD